MAAERNVELGYVEETEKFLLKSRFFPSKVGGVPAWLSLNPLPSAEELTCRVCSKPTVFLLQVYAPDSSKTFAFHRTVFIFICRNDNCCKANCADNLIVLRSQLPKVNDFFRSQPPAEVPIENEIDASKYAKLCRVCGGVGPKTCGKCGCVSYCSKEHQAVDWKAYHKRECSTNKTDLKAEKSYAVLFPEFEIVTETEIYTPKKDAGQTSEEEKMRQYKEFLESNKGSDLSTSFPEKELQSMASQETVDDKQIRKFKERISAEPDQILRYDKGGEPLWISQSTCPVSIPDCSCGAPRQFEFQVLPHLLSHLQVDKLGTSLDWGTLCVYTCSNSCDVGNQYVKEYIFKQDVV
ncbi:programmed cell death protein 2-like [Dreissena polymorpha]|uniref:programmed cell death protein 2-like n=1 Tax=Dreissena polymorpha TaxID=45954 RepID=UPI0022651193|nr:programmed cell death protein 2-like [Dreissena polymorpha]